MKTVQLNRKLVLEAAVSVPDGAGGHAETWTVLGNLWAEVRAGTGRETAAQAVTVSAVAYRILVRAAPVGSPARPAAGQRFRDGVRVFRILAVSEYDRHGRYLTCHTKEEVAQ